MNVVPLLGVDMESMDVVGEGGGERAMHMLMEDVDGDLINDDEPIIYG